MISAVQRKLSKSVQLDSVVVMTKQPQVLFNRGFYVARHIELHPLYQQPAARHPDEIVSAKWFCRLSNAIERSAMIMTVIATVMKMDIKMVI